MIDFGYKRNIYDILDTTLQLLLKLYLQEVSLSYPQPVAVGLPV